MSKLVILGWTILCAVWWWDAYSETLSKGSEQLSQGAQVGIGLGTIMLFVVWAIGSGAIAAFAFVFTRKKERDGEREQKPAVLRATERKEISMDGNIESDRKPCPYCAEDIKVAAKICRFCGRDLPDDWSVGNDKSSGQTGFVVDPKERIR